MEPASAPRVEPRKDLTGSGGTTPWGRGYRRPLEVPKSPVIPAREIVYLEPDTTPFTALFRGLRFYQWVTENPSRD